MTSEYVFKRSESLLSAQAGSPGPYWTCLMCQIACNKEMPSSHFFITLAALGWLTNSGDRLAGISRVVGHKRQSTVLQATLFSAVIIPTTCDAIVEEFVEEFIKCSASAEE